MPQPSAVEQQEVRSRRRERGDRGLRLLLLAGLGGLLVGLAASPLFAIREVQVIAPDPELAALARQALRLPAGASALLYPVAEVERQLRQAPQIRAAWVERELPGRLVVRVERRRPVAAVELPDRFLLVGDDGVILDQRAAGTAPRLPLFCGLSVTALAPGEPLPPAAAELVSEVTGAAQSAQLGPNLRVETAQPLDLRLTAGATEGLLGSPDNLTRKVLLFAQILQELSSMGHRPAVIDVRVMERPTWRPQAAGADEAQAAPAPRKPVTPARPTAHSGARSASPSTRTGDASGH